MILDLRRRGIDKVCDQPPLTRDEVQIGRLQAAKTRRSAGIFRRFCPKLPAYRRVWHADDYLGGAILAGVDIASRCRRASNRQTPEATDTFRLSTEPIIGIETI